jgi:hypothetical protein
MSTKGGWMWHSAVSAYILCNWDVGGEEMGGLDVTYRGLDGDGGQMVYSWTTIGRGIGG